MKPGFYEVEIVRVANGWWVKIDTAIGYVENRSREGKYCFTEWWQVEEKLRELGWYKPDTLNQARP